MASQEAGSISDELHLDLSYSAAIVRKIFTISNKCAGLALFRVTFHQVLLVVFFTYITSYHLVGFSLQLERVVIYRSKMYSVWMLPVHFLRKRNEEILHE